MEQFLTKEQYLATKAAWKNSDSHSAKDIIIYNLLRSFPLDRGFSLLTGFDKIRSNYNDEWHGYNKAVSLAYSNINSLKVEDKFPSWMKPDDIEKRKQYNAQKRLSTIDNFKNMFGIDLTDEIIDGMIIILGGARK